jgi:CPA2 family monovalent cation:H+ antiporter-2/glutathione-regulated potassium-efflux system protein KefB
MLGAFQKAPMPDPNTPASLLLPVLVFLAAAVLAVPIFRLLGLGAVIGYLAAGVAIGPHGLALVGNSATTAQVAELGVVLLLFLIGLELNPARAFAMRRDMALLGGLQMTATSLVIGLALWLGFGLDPRGAALAGVALAFSGTAVALQILEERGAVNSAYGRRAFAVLIFQDILVVPVLAIVPLLAGAAALGDGDWRDGLIAFAASLGLVAAVVLAGRYAINPVFALLARFGAREVMSAAALLVVLGAALVMNHAGLSMALGAFLAGLLLSESHFRHQLRADIEPFRGLLMGLFFMSVGMSLDIGLVGASAGGLLAATLGVLAVKAALVYALMRATGSNNCESVSGGAALTSAGEFAFVIFPLAAAAGLLVPSQAALLTAVAALTMVAGPLAANALDRLAERLRRPGEAPPAEAPPEGLQGSALVIGFGRFGQLAVQVLLAGRVDVTVIDRDVERIRNAARFGFKVYYGDGAHLDVLRAAGAGQARVIAVCVDDPAQTDSIVEMCKAEFPLAAVHARAYDRIHALRLIEQGVDAFSRETFESALVFGAQALGTISGDSASAAAIMSDVRQRDFERLAIQQAGGVYAPAAAHAGVQPEPLTQPSSVARPLSEETRAIVRAQESRLSPAPESASQESAPSERSSP